jgi:hypothetical protein
VILESKTVFRRRSRSVKKSYCSVVTLAHQTVDEQEDKQEEEDGTSSSSSSSCEQHIEQAPPVIN